jgi:hypothetical protein
MGKMKDKVLFHAKTPRRNVAALHEMNEERVPDCDAQLNSISTVQVFESSTGRFEGNNA